MLRLRMMRAPQKLCSGQGFSSSISQRDDKPWQQMAFYLFQKWIQHDSRQDRKKL